MRIFAGIAAGIAVIVHLILAVGFCLTWHELGHAVVYWANGVPVEKIMLGVGPLLWSHTFGFGTVFEVRLLWVGAGTFTAIDEGRPLIVSVAALLGGTFANILMAMGFYLGLSRSGVFRVPWGDPILGSIGQYVTFPYRLARNFVLAYRDGEHPPLVDTGKLSDEAGVWHRSAETVGGISLSLGLFNLLPVFPLDGGHIILKVLESAFGEGVAAAFGIFSLPAFLLLWLIKPKV